MNKITIKKLIEFRSKSDKSKITLVNNLNKESKGSGPDYWSSCLSAVRNSFKFNDSNILDEKIKLLNDKLKTTEVKKDKIQFQRNIDILLSFKDYNSNDLKPNEELNFLSQIKKNFILDINGFPIEAKPCFIYSFSEKNSDELAGVWFIAQKEGFTKNELGMFADILYRYLQKHYSKDYFINPNYCYAVDLFNGQEVSYSEIMNNNVVKLLDITIDEFKKYN